MDICYLYTRKHDGFDRYLITILDDKYVGCLTGLRDFAEIPVRLRPRVRVATLGDTPDGGLQLGGSLAQYASRVAAHRVDVFPERDSAVPSSLA